MFVALTLSTVFFFAYAVYCFRLFCFLPPVAALYFDGELLVTGGLDKTVRVQRNSRDCLEKVFKGSWCRAASRLKYVCT